MMESTTDILISFFMIMTIVVLVTVIYFYFYSRIALKVLTRYREKHHKKYLAIFPDDPEPKKRLWHVLFRFRMYHPRTKIPNSFAIAFTLGWIGKKDPVMRKLRFQFILAQVILLLTFLALVIVLNYLFYFL